MNAYDQVEFRLKVMSNLKIYTVNRGGFAQGGVKLHRA
jgi:hypothetical protein